MTNLPIDPNLLPLLDGVRPYLGAKAQGYTDMFKSMVKLLTSNSGREVITTMSRMLNPGQTVTAEGVLQGPVTGMNFAFALFLILILLLFASGGFGLPVVPEPPCDNCRCSGQEISADASED